MRERVNVEQGNFNTRWMGDQEAPQSLPVDTNGGWESAPVRSGDQRHPAHYQEEMATPRLRALPQTPASDPASHITPVTDLEARSSEVIPSRGCIVRPPESSSQAGVGTLGVEGSPSIPPELMNLLSWQNDQLRRLQDQVENLRYSLLWYIIILLHLGATASSSLSTESGGTKRIFCCPCRF